ncbi:hypothetical protein JXC34_05850 [Candidatus Woesearchaeota archaeon]|nr:hypothetical protein [Candidatus Woesearchaeota archaeon]
MRKKPNFLYATSIDNDYQILELLFSEYFLGKLGFQLSRAKSIKEVLDLDSVSTNITPFDAFTGVIIDVYLVHGMESEEFFDFQKEVGLSKK